MGQSHDVNNILSWRDFIIHTSGVGSCSKVGGYLSYQDTFVWRKLHYYGVTVKTEEAGVPPSFSTTCNSCHGTYVAKVLYCWLHIQTIDFWICSWLE